MSISTYSELQQAVFAWLLRDTTDLVVTAAQVQNYISLCEAELNRELKIMDLEETTPVTTSTTLPYVDLPSDFGRIITLEFDSQPYEMEFFPTRRDLKENFDTGNPGRPGGYTLFANRIYFSQQPSSALALTLDYFKRIPALSDSATSNAVLLRHPDVYLYGSLKQATLQTQDQDRITTWGLNYRTIIDRITQDDQFSRIPTGATMQGKAGRRLA